MEHPSKKSNIVEFFTGQSILITGGTGFVGKALIEKLVRSCPGLKNIYVLVRPKKGIDEKTRIESMLNCPLFQTIKSMTGGTELLTRLVTPICGDVTLPNLGLTPDSMTLIRDQVSIIIHSAATVRFDEAIKKAVKINVEGTHQILQLAKEMKILKAMVHVSTAYSNCEREEIEEIIYPTRMSPHDAIQTFNWMTEDMAESITSKLLADKPNTYTFTKHLAEQLVEEAMTIMKLPVCIVRPSIVAATSEDPIPGWVDNLNGASGILVAYGAGVLRGILCYDQNKLDIIPLDHVVSLIISAAWYTATAASSSSSSSSSFGDKKDYQQKRVFGQQRMTMGVFNCCSGPENPFYLRQAVPWAVEAYLKAPFSQVLWYPSPYITASPFLNFLNDYFLHYLPAQVMDLKCKVLGQKPMMMFIYRRVKAGVLALRYFCTHEWKFSTENTKTLHTLLEPEDRVRFKFNVRDVDWQPYAENYVFGLRRYTLKEADSTIPDAKKNLNRLYILHCGARAVLCLILFFVIGLLLQVTWGIF